MSLTKLFKISFFKSLQKNQNCSDLVPGNFFEKLSEQFLKELTGGLTSVTDGRILVKCQGEEKKTIYGQKIPRRCL